MSTTIRVSKDDKERLVRLAKRLNAKTMTEVLRMALTKAEEGNEHFEGNLNALSKTLRNARAHGGNVSKKVDEELAKAIEGR
jgi:predicted transcriptional regulator